MLNYTFKSETSKSAFLVFVRNNPCFAFFTIGKLKGYSSNFYPKVNVLLVHNQKKSHSVLLNLPSKSKIIKQNKRLK